MIKKRCESKSYPIFHNSEIKISETNLKVFLILFLIFIIFFIIIY